MKLFNIAFGNLKRRKGKVVFLVMGLLIGIATIVTLISVTESMTYSIEENLDRFGANIVMVPKNDNLSLSYGGINVGGINYEVKEFQEESLKKIREIEAQKNLGAVAPKVLGVSRVKGQDVLLMGVDLEVELALKTWWHFAETDLSSHSMLAGSEAAKILALQKGDKVTLGKEEFEIAAVLAPTGGNEDGLLIGDLHGIQRVLGKEGKVTMVEIVAFCRDCPITDMVLQLAEKFPDGKVTALKQAVMAKMQSIEMFKTFSMGIAGLVVFIGSLLVFVTMMGSVKERTREIGIFRAIGFRQGHIMQIILLEAIVVGFLGGITGFVSGNAIAWMILPLVMPGSVFTGVKLQLGVMVVLLAIALSLIASFYPARKGSRLDPSVALRTL